MNPYVEYPRHTPPPSCKGRAEFVGTHGAVDVWWDKSNREYWYNIPGNSNSWADCGQEPCHPSLKPAFPLAEAHRILLLP